MTEWKSLTAVGQAVVLLRKKISGKLSRGGLFYILISIWCNYSPSNNLEKM